MIGSILLITVTSLLHLVGLTDAQTLHVCTSPVDQQCNLDCETPDQSVSVLFTDPSSNTAGSCTASGTCLSVIAGYSVARVNSTITRLTIASLSYTRDYGNWTCSHDVTESNTVLVPCPSPKPNITVTVDGNNITSTAKCQFPVSAYTSFSLEYADQEGNLKTVNSNASPVFVNVTADGCESHETNVILTQPKPDDICGNVNFKSTFVNIYLGTITGSLFSENEDYNWHILVGWIVGVLIIPVAGLFCCIFNVFIAKKSHMNWSAEQNKKFILVAGLILGGGVLVSLIVCIIIATQVCFSTFSDAFGLGIGLSFGIMFICVIIVVVIFCTCMKGKKAESVTVVKDEIDSEETCDTAAPKTETSKDRHKSDDKQKAVGVAKPIVQDRPKSKALEDVPKNRQLPNPKKDNYEDDTIRMPTKLPPIDHENVSSSPKKKKKKKKKMTSKDTDSENEEKVDSQ